MSRWGAQRPQDFSSGAQIAGAALQPFRDTRPLLHSPRCQIYWFKTQAGIPRKGRNRQCNHSISNRLLRNGPTLNRSRTSSSIRGSSGRYSFTCR